MGHLRGVYIILLLFVVGCGGGGIKVKQALLNGGTLPSTNPTPIPTPDPGCVNNYTVVLTWTPPTTNTDGSALTDLTTYQLFYGEVSSSYSTQFNLPAPATTYSWSIPSGRFYYFSAKAVNSTGTESAYSNEATRDLTACPSKAGEIIHIVLFR